MENRLLAIVGPTAVGKSALALRLAKRFGGEIVSADSRQVYRWMDIGTAKPSPQDRAAVTHHLIDVVNPDDEYSLAVFLRQATAAIKNVESRSKLPILAGGTGQYVWGLLEGWRPPEVLPDAGLRRRLEERATLEGAPALYQDLSRLDPAAAGRIDPLNVRRVIRALEVCYSSPDRQPGPPRAAEPPYHTKILGLTLERATLYRRIDDRADQMIENGWIDEVRALLERGYGAELPSLSSLGYRELVQHLNNELSLEDAIERIKFSTHRFVRHQYAWFRPGDERIRWLDASGNFDQAEAEVVRWLEDTASC